MKKLFFLTIFIALTILSQAQKAKEFVCIPCGNSCDLQTQKGPGKCSACGMMLVEKSAIHFGNLTYEEFCKHIAARPDALILDVRSPAEFKGTTQDIPTFGHFKNAININITELEARMGEIAAYKDKEVLVYCSHNHRSPQASYILGANGFKTVNNMAGGVSTFEGKNNDKLLMQSFVFHSH